MKTKYVQIFIKSPKTNPKLSHTESNFNKIELFHKHSILKNFSH